MTPRPAAVARAAAYHEAGHAVASWRQGDGIGEVSIEPRTDPVTGDGIGGLFTLLRGGDRSLASGWGHRNLVMTLAGAAAQHRHDPRSCIWSCATGDFRSARDFAAIMTRSRESERALLAWAQAEARALIAADWHLVEILAHALIEAVTIEGTAAMAILDAAEAAESARLRRAHAADPPRGLQGPSRPAHSLRAVDPEGSPV